MKIFDCSTFYQSNVLFELRFNILKNIVDHFVVCESNLSHTRRRKKFTFNYKKWKKYKDKIIYIKLTNIPEHLKDHSLLQFQAEQINQGLVNASSNDLIIYSDEDEIVNPKSVKTFLHNKFKFGVFMQNSYYYKFNIQSKTEGDGNWPGSRICQKKNLTSFTKLKLLKIKNLTYPFWRFDKEKSIQIIKQGGWHFTYLMTPKQISMKINDMVYQNLNNKNYNNHKIIEKKIENLEDLFGRGFILKKVKIDNTYPSYLKKNIKYYKKWIS